MLPWNSSVIRRKGESQNRCCKKTKHVKFSEKRTFLTYWYAHVRVHNQGVRNIIFRKIWRALFSWNTCSEIRPFTLLPTNFTLSQIFFHFFIRFLSGFSFLSEKMRISLEAITILLFKVFNTLTWRPKHAFQIRSKK